MAQASSSVSSWKSRLADAWMSRNALSRALWPLSLSMEALVRIRAALYRADWLPRQRLPVPVIVVGNVVVGGAGKTPTVMAIIRHLQQQGHHPGVISRGYGRMVAPGSSADAALDVQADTPAHLAGDEPLLIRQATGVPVVVARRRIDAGRQLLALYPCTTVLVCDDGLQHLVLHADIAVAVFDERGLGNGWLLPAGLLREPWPDHTSRRIDMVLHIGNHGTTPAPLPCPPGTRIFQASRSLADEAISAFGHRIPLHTLAANRVRPNVALAGIAKPQVFFDMLHGKGIYLTQKIALEDHHDFSEPNTKNDNQEVWDAVNTKQLFMTEKDAVKLFPLIRNLKSSQPADLQLGNADTPNAWAIPLTLSLEQAFLSTLDQKLSLIHGHQTA